MQIKIEGGTPADFQARLESILCAEDSVLDPSDAAALAKTLTQQLGVRSDLINEFPFRVRTVDLLIHNTADAEDEIHELLSNLCDDNPDVVVEWAGHQPTREISGPAARKHFESEVEYPDEGDPRLDALVPPHERVACVVRSPFSYHHETVDDLIEEIADKTSVHLPEEVIFRGGDGIYYSAVVDVVVRPTSFAQAAEAVKAWNHEAGRDFDLPQPLPQWQRG